MERRFALAPMSRAIAVLTAVGWLVPALFVGLAIAGVAAPFLLGLGALVALLYAAIWIWWRPGAFVVSGAGLELRFPGRRLAVPGHELTGARQIDAAGFRREFGLALRVGAGGLWGGFGWLWTRRGGWVEFYVSRTDGFVLLTRRGGTPLLLTPEDPEGFVEALRVAGALG